MTRTISASAISKPIPTGKLSRIGACFGIGGIGGVLGSANRGGGVSDSVGGAEGVPGATYGIACCEGSCHVGIFG